MTLWPDTFQRHEPVRSLPFSTRPLSIALALLSLTATAFAALSPSRSPTSGPKLTARPSTLRLSNEPSTQPPKPAEAPSSYPPASISAEVFSSNPALPWRCKPAPPFLAYRISPTIP